MIRGCLSIAAGYSVIVCCVRGVDRVFMIGVIITGGKVMCMGDRDSAAGACMGVICVFVSTGAGVGMIGGLVADGVCMVTSGLCGDSFREGYTSGRRMNMAEDGASVLDINLDMGMDASTVKSVCVSGALVSGCGVVVMVGADAAGSGVMGVIGRGVSSGARVSVWGVVIAGVSVSVVRVVVCNGERVIGLGC